MLEEYLAGVQAHCTLAEAGKLMVDLIALHYTALR